MYENGIKESIEFGELTPPYSFFLKTFIGKETFSACVTVN
jgi:hypothetical protein